MASANQILVKLLGGDTRCLTLPSSSVSGAALKLRLHPLTGVPPHLQLLVAGSRLVHDDTLLLSSEDGSFPSCALLLRLRGGKGGFGSLLRGAATKAGQKKTNNFDACRDMSGRRLRHVNAERRLEEWKAEAEERRLEKVAEDFLRKKAKETRKSNSKEVERYMEKCKEVTEKCVGEVDDAVRQSFGLYEEGKRKALPASGAASKRLKIWLGKNKLDESESEDDRDDASDSEDEKSMLIDGRNSKNDTGSSGTVSGAHSEAESSDRGSDGNNAEEEYDLSIPNTTIEVGQGSTSGHSNVDSDDLAEASDRAQRESYVRRLVLEPGSLGDDTDLLSEGSTASEVLLQEQVDTPKSLKEETGSGSPAGLDEIIIPSTTSLENLSMTRTANMVEVASLSEPIDPAEGVVKNCQGPAANSENQSPLTSNSGEPLNFDKYNSASDLESLGMERLKVELQANGLKCGGTLQERAARLFLLKTTPVDKLPRKVLAKLSAGGK